MQLSCVPKCGQVITVKILADLFFKNCAASFSGLDRDSPSLHANWWLSHLLLLLCSSLSSIWAAASAGLEWNPVPHGAVSSPSYSSPGRHPQMLYAGHAMDCLSEHSVFRCSCCSSAGHSSGYTACVVLLCCALQLCSKPELYWGREFLSLFLWSFMAGDENYHPASEWGYSQKGISLWRMVEGTVNAQHHWWHVGIG